MPSLACSSGAGSLFMLFLAALTIPSQVEAVPDSGGQVHALAQHAGQPDRPALIQVLGVFILRQHFRTIPQDLDDAARVDGAGHMKILRHVMVPMSWPAISAVMVLTGQYIWNDFFWPNLFITNPNRMTAPLALYYQESSLGAARSGPYSPAFRCSPCPRSSPSSCCSAA